MLRRSDRLSATTSVHDRPPDPLIAFFAQDRHAVHALKDTAAGRLGEDDLFRLQVGERPGWQAFA
jgi:hypothetical protein